MRVRPTVRVLLLDPLDRVLLFRYVDERIRDPNDAAWSPDRHFWALAGGGMEAGESRDDAARRELREETGLTNVALGRVVLEREKVLAFDDDEVLFQEVYLLGRTRVTDVSWNGAAPEEVATLREYRWWTLAELRATGEAVFPEGLAELVAAATGGTAVG